MNKPRLLIIEDDEPIRTQMKWALIKDYDVSLAQDGQKAMEAVKEKRPALVTLDLGLPPHPEDTSEGLRLLGQILQEAPATKVIVVTGNPDKSAALKAISIGAHDFFTKPIDVEELKAILKRAGYVHTLESELLELQKQQSGKPFFDIIGSDDKMQEIFATVRKVATTDVPVLVTGQSGTGKELVASAIHSNSLRSKNPFIPINCGAIPENLIESELFGHEKGAFTGAHIQRSGKIELADGGTLFLDEIGELPTPLQVKLLRFLQDYKIERVGGREILDMDVRIIAATNKDLKEMIAEGRFREDLYYRLAVIELMLPPLKERGEDILLLARAFVQKFSPEGTKPRPLSEEAVDAMYAYDWPGNVRELENKIRRAITLAEGPVLTASDIGLEAPEGSADSLDLRQAREKVEKRVINKAILKHNYNISKAADELGLTRPTLHHLIKKYDITTKHS
ncbi:MAG: PEP-CTERM-box response regulator transcription factor [Thermodesulfobacteriota bacterium]|nr:MAG: PEP-CTERM-box response regulator transcription factor [Thermodesulfobacteriota bacterium]